MKVLNNSVYDNEYIWQAGYGNYIDSGYNFIAGGHYYFLERKILNVGAHSTMEFYVDGLIYYEIEHVDTSNIDLGFLEMRYVNEAGAPEQTEIYIDNILLTYVWNGADLTPPVISAIWETPYAGDPLNTSYLCSDNVALSGYIFEENSSGALQNTTWTAFTTNPQWANFSIPTTVEHYYLQANLYVNDSSNNWVVDAGGMEILLADLYYFDFTFQDANSASVPISTLQWSINNGSSYDVTKIFPYIMGEVSITDDSYTLSVSYKNLGILTDSFSASNYGNTTTIEQLTMNPWSDGYIAWNDSPASATTNIDDGIKLNATMSGA